MASVSTIQDDTKPHRLDYTIDDVDYNSEEEEQLLPPPKSWFEPPSPTKADSDYSSNSDHNHDSADDEQEYDRTTQSYSGLPSNSSCFSVESIDDPDHLSSFCDDFQNNNCTVVVGPAPSFKELSTHILPAAAKELLSTSVQRLCHYSCLSYSQAQWRRQYSDLGKSSGYFRSPDLIIQNEDKELEAHAERIDFPPFSSLAWVDRQLVKEWRTSAFLSEHGSSQSSESNKKVVDDEEDDDADTDEEDFDRARTLVPQPSQRPKWQKADMCFKCAKPFGPTLLRHHCRLCGNSYCGTHSPWTATLPHLGYHPQVPERVCDSCKRLLTDRDLAERIAWRRARCRDFLAGELVPYFETGVDTVEDAALRITKASIAMLKSIPLGAQAHVAVETIDVLRKHGIKGIYGLILRKEFMAAADLLCRALGINKTAWPLSVHELSAAIFYALAQHRALRGMSPEREHLIHTVRPAPRNNSTDKINSVNLSEEGEEWGPFVSAWTESPQRQKKLSTISEEKSSAARADNKDSSLVDTTDAYDPLSDSVTNLIAMADSAIQSQQQNGGDTEISHNKDSASVERESEESKADAKKPNQDDGSIPEDLPFTPVCEPVSDAVISSLIFYAPIAMNFVYATREVDMQLLAAQQGWRLLYAHLDQDTLDRPASALFIHREQKIACFAVRGTATINDVVTDIRQMPVPFPEEAEGGRSEDDWTPVFRGQGLAVCGMASAALNLYREHIDCILHLVENGYRIRITGHSLGGGVATLLGALILRHIENLANLEPSLENAMKSALSNSGNEGKNSVVQRNDMLRVYGYGTPSCVDAKLSDYVKSFVTTVVLHDDVVPRLTPTSIRSLLKHLLHIRETWVKAHLTNDLIAITERARTAWAPRWRSGFTMNKSTSRSFKRYCRKQIQVGKRKLLSVQGKLVSSSDVSEELSREEGGEQKSATGDESIIICPGEDDDVPTENKEAEDKGEADQSESAANAGPHLLLDYMGGIDYRTQGVVIDGDEFYDAEESLLEGDEESTSGFDSLINTREFLNDSRMEEHAKAKAVPLPTEVEDESWAKFDESFDASLDENLSATEKTPIKDSPYGSESSGELEESDDMCAVMLEETPLPRMFLPGRIVHIYTHRGGYKAAYVPRAFRELRRISLAGNMLSDHTSKNYYESLLEVQSVRSAQEGLPRWTAFDEDDTCSCCASRFTWASTSDTEAQAARDKHNCRSCGTLVCDPCSKNRMPLPTIGISLPVRVCDRCYNDIGGVLTGQTGEALTSSFIASESQQKANTIVAEQFVTGESVRSSPTSSTSPALDKSVAEPNQPERQRERRSLVVDELASRINASVTTST